MKEMWVSVCIIVALNLFSLSSASSSIHFVANRKRSKILWFMALIIIKNLSIQKNIPSKIVQR